MEKKLKLPIGIENFSELRKRNYYYVDKTELIEQVLEDAGVFKRDKQGKEAFARFVEQLGWFGIYENELLHDVQ